MARTVSEQLAVDWLLWLRDVKGRSQSTITTYTRVLMAWEEWATSHNVEPLRPTLEELEKFIKRKTRQGKARSAADRAKQVAILSGWFSWMHQREYLEENYALDLQGPTVKHKEGRPIPDEEWEALWDVVPTRRLRAVLGLGFFCGLRSSELQAVTYENITDTKLWRLKRKGGDEHTVPYADLATLYGQRLPNLLPDPHQFVLDVQQIVTDRARLTPWNKPGGLNLFMDRLCAKAGTTRFTPHQLRHSTATNLLRMGVEPHTVMRIMNHSSFDMTMRYVGEAATSLKGLIEG